MKKTYVVVLNSDRVHISSDGTPVETILFSTYAEPHTDGKVESVGIAVCKCLQFNKGQVSVKDLSD